MAKLVPTAESRITAKFVEILLFVARQLLEIRFGFQAIPGFLATPRFSARLRSVSTLESRWVIFGKGGL